MRDERPGISFFLAMYLALVALCTYSCKFGTEIAVKFP